MATWRERTATPFTTEKRPATGSRGIVVTNLPLASAGGAEMLTEGGNAVDAAVAALFTLNVVEPMLVGILGSGFANILVADGTQTILESQGRCPQGGQPPSRPTPLPARVCSMRWAGATAWPVCCCTRRFSMVCAPVGGARSGAWRHLALDGAAGRWRARWAPVGVRVHGLKPRATPQSP